MREAFVCPGPTGLVFYEVVPRYKTNRREYRRIEKSG